MDKFAKPQLIRETVREWVATADPIRLQKKVSDWTKINISPVEKD